MNDDPGVQPPGSSLFVFRRPTLALLIAGAGFALGVIVLLLYPGWQRGMITWPGWLQQLIALVVISAPLVIAVIVAARIAADRARWAALTRRWTVTDVVLGLAVGLLIRAVLELVHPTTGALFGPFEVEWDGAQIALAIILIAGVVLITPAVEEFFFRGLVQGAMADMLAPYGRVTVSIITILFSTALFVALHIVPAGATVSWSLLLSALGIGLGTGILTALTGRIAAAITAHVVFNAIGVFLLL